MSRRITTVRIALFMLPVWGVVGLVYWVGKWLGVWPGW